MRIGIFGRDDDPIALHTAAVARGRGHEVVTISFAPLVGDAPAAFDGRSWLWRGEPVERCDAFVVRQYPSRHALLAPPDETATAADWYRRGRAQVERASFAESAIMDMELRGKPTVNPVLASSPFDHKPLQLAALARAGLPVPQSLVTNDPDAARRFDAEVTAQGGELVCKPAAGGAATRLVDDAVRAQLHAIGAPVIFQRRVHGPDVRVTIVGDRVVSAVTIEGDGGVDYRSGAAYQRGDVRYSEHPLPRATEQACLAAARLCRHVLSGIDLKREGDGDYMILEANSAPMYLDIERKTGAPITLTIVRWLEASARLR